MTASGTFGAVRVLLAADATWIVDEITAALGDEDTSFVVCTEGREVAGVVEDGGPFDVVLLDLQIGSMGGIAVTMSLRLDESGGRLPNVPVLVLLDRIADVHLARRSGADGWLVKPLDPLRIRRAVRAVTNGRSYREGLVDGVRGVQPEPADTATVDVEAVDAEQADVVPAPSR